MVQITYCSHLQILEEQNPQTEVSASKTFLQFLNELTIHSLPQKTPRDKVHLVCTDSTVTGKHCIQTNIPFELSLHWKEMCRNAAGISPYLRLTLLP